MTANANKYSSDMEKIDQILESLYDRVIEPMEAKEQLLDLFGVMESDCDHEWINHSFDHFGFLQEQICDKCGAKQSVP
jgi:hypothetical protein